MSCWCAGCKKSHRTRFCFPLCGHCRYVIDHSKATCRLLKSSILPVLIDTRAGGSSPEKPFFPLQHVFACAEHVFYLFPVAFYIRHRLLRFCTNHTIRARIKHHLRMSTLSSGRRSVYYAILKQHITFLGEISSIRPDQ